MFFVQLLKRLADLLSLLPWGASSSLRPCPALGARCRRERFHIEATTHQIAISGKIQLQGPEGAELRYQEVEPQPFQRTLKLAKSIQPEKVSAIYRDGILTLPKADAGRAVKVQIGTSTSAAQPATVTVESQTA